MPLLADPATTSWRKRFLLEHYLSTWDDEPDRVVNHYSLSAVRATDEAPRVPLRLYAEYFGGLQLENGWYAIRPDTDEFELPLTSPDAPFVMLSPAIDRELHNKFLDPYEEENLLYNLAQRPNASQLEGESAELSAWMNALVQCAGASCQLLENWWPAGSQLGNGHLWVAGTIFRGQEASEKMVLGLLAPFYDLIVVACS